MIQNRDIIIDELNKYMDKSDIKLDKGQLNQFATFYEILIEKNKVMNLTAIVEPEEVVKKHFIDSLSILDIGYVKEVNNIIDIGTGAGFPGLPLAIVLPDIKFTLIDSLQKRINFIEEVCKACNIKNVEAFHGRAEDFGHDDSFREMYDICVSRAVANLSTLSEYCIPFVKVGGKFISYKSGSIEEEVENSKNAMDKLGAKIEDEIHFVLPLSDIERSFVVINKIATTKNTYPRSAGKPSKKPL